MLNRSATIGTCSHEHGIVMFLVTVAVVLLVLHAVGFDRLGNGIRAGENLAAARPRGLVAGDALELLHDLLRSDVAPERERDKPSNRLGLARGAPARLSDMVEDLEGHTVLIFIHGNVKSAAAGFHDPGRALDRLGPPPRNDLPGL